MRIFLFFAFLVFADPLLAEERAFSLLPKKPLNVSRLGTNAFVNDSRFGSIKGQLSEVKNVLGIKYIRVLFAWNDQIQSSPSSTPNFSFYDDIARNIPRGTQALVIVTGLPSWMKNSNNWIDGDPRKTFVESWVSKVAARYKSNKKIKAIQVWNEQNMESNPDNSTLGISNSAELYVDMLALAYQRIKQVAPNKLVVSGATTAINQNYPETIDYNEVMLEQGAEQYLDVWAMHFYGSHLENVLRPGGLDDFAKELTKPIWITESGAQGTTKQQSYARQYWPFLLDLIPGIKRIYIYQFTESTPAASTYGLKNLTKGSILSDLYIYLREAKRAKR